MTEAAERTTDPDLAAIDQVRATIASYNRAMAGVVAELCAQQFGVRRQDIMAKHADRSTAYGRSCATARNCAMYLLNVGLDWTVTRIAPDFGVRRTAATASIQKVEDLREADPETDAWLTSIETLLNGNG